MQTKDFDKDYKLIPMAEITEEARTIAVRWMECDDKNWIGNKHKLASDIMNYARRHAAQFTQQEGGEKDFAKWLEENTTVIREEKITLYRYCDVDGWGNYILDDIYLVFKEKYEPEASNSDLAPVASHSCAEGNNIEQETEPFWQGQMYIQGGELPKAEKLFEDHGLRLELTCGACPEQYDVFKQVGYLRLRHGEFRVDFPECGGETIYEANPAGDGIFEGGERMKYLTEAMNAILKKINKNPNVQVSDTTVDDQSSEAGNQSNSNQWIDVKDGLPERGDSVLIFPQMRVAPFGNSDDELDGNETDKTFWYWDVIDEEAKVISGVTHWQPLPQPPASKQKPTK